MLNGEVMQANSFTSTYQTRIDGCNHEFALDDICQRPWSDLCEASRQAASETFTERVLGFVEKYGEFTHD